MICIKNMLSLKATALKLLPLGKCGAAVTPRIVPPYVLMEQPWCSSTYLSGTAVLFLILLFSLVVVL